MKGIEKNIENTVEWIRKVVTDAGLKGVVVGLSGGIDSALAAALMKRAFPKDSLGIIIPIKSNSSDKEDALSVAKALDMEHYVIDLTDEHSKILDKVTEKVGKESPSLRLSDANLRARLRMSTIYTFANLFNYMVVGTDNAAEIHTGYFTKFGDGGCDILPLSNLLKKEVYEWAEFLGIPEPILQRPPSAGLWEGQTDEKEMGTTYDFIDAYLSGKEIPEKDKEIIDRMHARTEHKRQMPMRCPEF